MYVCMYVCVCVCVYILYIYIYIYIYIRTYVHVCVNIVYVIHILHNTARVYRRQEIKAAMKAACQGKVWPATFGTRALGPLAMVVLD